MVLLGKEREGRLDGGEMGSKTWSSSKVKTPIVGNSKLKMV